MNRPIAIRSETRRGAAKRTPRSCRRRPASTPPQISVPARRALPKTSPGRRRPERVHLRRSAGRLRRQSGWRLARSPRAVRSSPKNLPEPGIGEERGHSPEHQSIETDDINGQRAERDRTRKGNDRDLDVIWDDHRRHRRPEGWIYGEVRIVQALADRLGDERLGQHRVCVGRMTADEHVGDSEQATVIAVQMAT